MHVDFLSVLKGGFFLMKKPIKCVPSVYTNSETAITACAQIQTIVIVKPVRARDVADIILDQSIWDSLWPHDCAQRFWAQFGGPSSAVWTIDAVL